MSDYVCKTREQKAAKAAFEKLIANEHNADAAYDALPETQNGRIISTDLVRELDDVYANWKEGDPPRDLAPSWEKAWIYSQNRLAGELSRKGQQRIVRFMAGGWAAGKTRVATYLTSQGSSLAALTWDGTLKDTSWARRQICSALSNDWRVEIVYVHRNIELALYGAIERGKKEGRFVPLDELPSNHRAVQQSIRRLITSFGKHPNVSFLLFHNIGSAGLSRVPMKFEEYELAPKGALHYRISHERYYCTATDEIKAVCD